MRNILFDTQLFDNESERASSQKRVLVLLEALTLLDLMYLEEHPETPLIYRSGIQYKLPAQFGDGPGEGGVPGYRGEVFRDVPRILENGGGDCDNVACWRAAEIRFRLGVAAKPYITWRTRPDGGTTYHVIVLWPDGSSEDPSLLLGMGGAAKEKERAEEVRKLAERAAEILLAMKAPGHEREAENLVREAQLRNANTLLVEGWR